MKNDREVVEKKYDENLENIAAVVHEVWSHWQKYLHSQCIKQSDGSLKIPKDLVSQWNKQINLKYDQLTESEKNSDIEQAFKYKKIFVKIINEILEERDT
ncbi:hypothetical protein ABFP02_12775 [Acinetobacter baumannii]